MADLEKRHDASSDPENDAEKTAELSRNTTYGNGEVNDARFLQHANAGDGDEALKAFIGHDGEVVILTPEMERKLLRKIDLNLMPARLPLHLPFSSR